MLAKDIEDVQHPHLCHDAVGQGLAQRSHNQWENIMTNRMSCAGGDGRQCIQDAAGRRDDIEETECSLIIGQIWRKQAFHGIIGNRAGVAERNVQADRSCGDEPEKST